MSEDATCIGLALAQGCEPARELVECQPHLARRVSPDGGVPLVGPQEELRGPNGYTPRGITSSPGQEAKYKFSGFITTKKMKRRGRIFSKP